MDNHTTTDELEQLLLDFDGDGSQKERAEQCEQLLLNSDADLSQKGGEEADQLLLNFNAYGSQEYEGEENLAREIHAPIQFQFRVRVWVNRWIKSITNTAENNQVAAWYQNILYLWSYWR